MVMGSSQTGMTGQQLQDRDTYASGVKNAHTMERGKAQHSRSVRPFEKSPLAQLLSADRYAPEDGDIHNQLWFLTL